ncbi:hypothetical protein [Bremerella sp.]|uniref:hypothetical protein n=1 Tax=Bremerella sp. TaxID=2795602 RepID=UPI00391C707A
MSTEPLVPEHVTREWIQQASVERLFLYVQRLNRQLHKDLKQKQQEVERLQHELAASKAASKAAAANTQPPPGKPNPAPQAPRSTARRPERFQPIRALQEGSGVAPDAAANSIAPEIRPRRKVPNETSLDAGAEGSLPPRSSRRQATSAKRSRRLRPKDTQLRRTRPATRTRSDRDNMDGETASGPAIGQQRGPPKPLFS